MNFLLLQVEVFVVSGSRCPTSTFIGTYRGGGGGYYYILTLNFLLDKNPGIVFNNCEGNG